MNAYENLEKNLKLQYTFKKPGFSQKNRDIGLTEI